MSPCQKLHYQPSPSRPPSILTTAWTSSPTAPPPRYPIRRSGSRGRPARRPEDYLPLLMTASFNTDVETSPESGQLLLKAAEASSAGTSPATPTKDKDKDNCTPPCTRTDGGNTITRSSSPTLASLSSDSTSPSRNSPAAVLHGPIYPLGPRPAGARTFLLCVAVLLLLLTSGLQLKIASVLWDFPASRQACPPTFLLYPDPYAVLRLPPPPRRHLYWYGATYPTEPDYSVNQPDPSSAAALAAARRAAARCWHPDKASLNGLGAAAAARVWARYEAAVGVLRWAEGAYDRLKSRGEENGGLGVTLMERAKSSDERMREWWELVALLEGAGGVEREGLPMCGKEGEKPGVLGVLRGWVRGRWFGYSGVGGKRGPADAAGQYVEGMGERDEVMALLRQAVKRGRERIESDYAERLQDEANQRNEIRKFRDELEKNWKKSRDEDKMDWLSIVKVAVLITIGISPFLISRTL